MAEIYIKLGIEEKQRRETILQKWRDRVGFKFTLMKRIERYIEWNIADWLFAAYTIGGTLALVVAFAALFGL